jgi:formylmethanofuran dehydrogenase subunit E
MMIKINNDDKPDYDKIRKRFKYIKNNELVRKCCNCGDFIPVKYIRIYDNKSYCIICLKNEVLK